MVKSVPFFPNLDDIQKIMKIKGSQDSSYFMWFKRNIMEQMIACHFICQFNGSRDPTEGMKEISYLTTHSTHFIYGYMASDI